MPNPKRGPRFDLTGRKFGRWTVLRYDPSGSTTRRETNWWCRCECGVEARVRGGNLTSGAHLSCGCLRTERVVASRKKPLESGAIFGMLRVVTQGESLRTPNGGLRIRYTCACDCGKTVLVHASSLRSGASTSCGCTVKESAPERALFAEVRSAYPEAVNRVRGLLRSSRMELDIWVPSLRAAVEFDGRGWHAFGDGPERDARKGRECAEVGIRLLRVDDREYKRDPAGETARVLSWLRGLTPG